MVAKRKMILEMLDLIPIMKRKRVQLLSKFSIIVDLKGIWNKGCQKKEDFRVDRSNSVDRSHFYHEEDFSTVLMDDFMMEKKIFRNLVYIRTLGLEFSTMHSEDLPSEQWTRFALK